MMREFAAFGLGSAIVLGLLIISSSATYALPHRDGQSMLVKGLENKMLIVRTKADLQRFDGQKVILLGRYERLNQPKADRPLPGNLVVEPITGIPGFQPGNRPYAPAQVVLEDGWNVSIFPRWNKQSLRSPDELEDYESKNVEVTGVVQWKQENGLVGSSINLEKLRLNLRESKLYDPRSLVQELEKQPFPVLKAWNFLKQWEPSTPSEPWRLARTYDLEVSGDRYTLTLFRNIPQPSAPTPQVGPNGEQSAFSTGGEPDHVVGLKLQRHTESIAQKNAKPTFWPTLKTLSTYCFGATDYELQSLEAYLPKLVQQANTSKSVVRRFLLLKNNFPMKPLEVAVETKVDENHQFALTLWRQDSVESRKTYCDLEPRNIRI